MTTLAYLRVSKDTQDTKNQRLAIFQVPLIAAVTLWFQQHLGVAMGLLQSAQCQRLRENVEPSVG